MASVFISYSRQDQTFVLNLSRVLKEANREPWVDWERIPPTSEWLKEIFAAIDSADTFVFILSPDSIASGTCAQEAKHAVESRKRIIPIVCRSVDPLALRENEALAPLAQLQWIFMREQDNISAGLSQLRFALDTDLEYWHLSTRLLVRAQEWVSQARNKQLTLRGPELTEAERWLTAGADREPRPARLQLEFIAASRRVASGRQRRLVAWVSAALAVTLILALISTSLFYVTRTQNTQLQDANDALLVRSLVGASSTTLASGHIDQALLLAAEASQQATAYHQESTNSRSSLLQTLQSYPNLDAVLQGPPTTTAQLDEAGFGSSLGFSRDGQTLLSSTAAGQISVWDVHAKKLQARFSVPCSSQYASLSPNGQIVATVSETTDCSPAEHPGLDLWNAYSGAHLVHLHISDGGGGIAFSPDGEELAVESASVEILKLPSAQVVGQFPYPASGFGNSTVAFLPNNQLLVGGLSGSTEIFNAVTGNLVRAYDLSNLFLSLAFAPLSEEAVSPNGKIIALGGDAQGGSAEQSAVLFVNAISGALISEITVGTIDQSLGTAPQLAFTADSSGVVLSTGSNLQLWEVGLTSPTTTFSLGDLAPVSDIAFSSGGRVFATSHEGGEVLLWNLIPGLSSSIPVGGICPVAFSPSGAQIATCFRSEVNLWDSSLGTEVAHFNACPSELPTSAVTTLGNVAFAPDGKTMAVACWYQENYYQQPSPTVQLWDLATYHRVGVPFAVPKDFTPSYPATGESEGTPVGTLQFSANGRYLAYDLGHGNSEGPGAIWQVSSRQIVLAVTNSSAVAFSPDSSQIAIATTNTGVVKIMDLVTSRTVKTWMASASEIAFSPDGRSLASIEGDGVVTISDVSTGRVTTTFTVSSSFSGVPCPLGYSPDGKLLVACYGYTIAFWDTATHEPFVESLVEPTPIYTIAISPNSQLLAEEVLGGPVIVRPITVAGWEAWACSIANRNLTHAEWQQFFAGTDEPYHKTCPNLPAGP